MEENVLRLAKPKKKGLLSLIFSRFLLIAVLLVLQAFFYVAVFVWLDRYLSWFWLIRTAFSLIMLIYLFISDIDASAKLTWLLILVALPFAGAVFLAYTQTNIGHRTMKEREAELINQTKTLIPQPEHVVEKLKEDGGDIEDLAKYVGLSGCYPVYDNTEVKFFPLGELKFEAMLEELEKAERFIFMEYFIIEEGYMWGRILDILARKAKEGVDVRVMYDGMCEMSTLPVDYWKLLEKQGIHAKPFAPIIPILSTHYNYRDHRKILVIDGKVAFNGGVNLADEYINKIERFGHWKDTAVMLKGDAVRSFTLLFLQMWNIDEKEPEFQQWVQDGAAVPAEAFGTEEAAVPVASGTEEAAVPVASGPEEAAVPVASGSEEAAVPVVGPGADGAAGYVMPYGDCPLDEYKVGEMVYMDLLNRAGDYVHIMTPYLILDGELETALKFAAQRGVDVKLILPGIPDKKAAFALAKSHYKSLTSAGVKIYEYTPGFVHAKVCVSDDEKAVVGTINFDYRSLYHHFECATYMYKVNCISDIEKDFQETLAKCRPVTEESIKNEKLSYTIRGMLMKFVAPLM